MNAKNNLPRQAIADYCLKWQITEFSLFGSALRQDFGPDSDVDVLVRFSPDARHSLFDMVRMRDELKQILGREVDLVSRRGIEASRNHLRRRAIMESAEVVYGT